MKTTITTALVLLTLVATTAPAATTIIGLLPGGNFRIGTGLSADGLAATGYGSSSVAGNEAFRWTPEVMEGLGLLPGYVYSFGQGVSADGTAIAGYVESSTRARQAFRWTAEGGLIGLGYLPGGTYSEGYGMSGDGTVVVGRAGSPGSVNGQAFRWSPTDGMTGLGFLPNGAFSFATDVSGDGSVVVGRALSGQSVLAFRWTEETGMIGLGGCSSDSRATAVSLDGGVIVGTANCGQSQAFRWSADDGFEYLGVLPGGTFTEANGVSQDGAVVVGHANDGQRDQAFIWTREGGMQRLLDVVVAGGATEFQGWQLYNAIDVSADGRSVLVTAFDTQRRSYQIIVSLVPVPPTALLFVSAGLSVIGRVRRRRGVMS